MTHNRSTDISRRRMLARGAALGGAVWAAPTVTAITLSPANAASPSGVPPKPPEPPEPPKPPDDHEPKPPRTREPEAPAKPDGEKPGAPPAAPPEQETTAGGLPDTGPGDVARTVALGGALAAGGAALYRASRVAGAGPSPTDDDPSIPGS